MSKEVLKKLDSHFAFGENWASYSKLIGEPQIEHAKEGLLKLISAEDFKGRSFLDIGCGSGLHTLAASRLGVSRIVGVDIDPNSTATARKILAERDPSTPWQIENISVFDLTPAHFGMFHIVYSWGVLHHTGDMWQAVSKAAALVAPGGLLVVAFYRETYLDPFWKLEKRFYTSAPSFVRNVVKSGYIGAFRFARAVTRQGPFADYIANYTSRRGMDFDHDVHDWLGGYPYESALAPEVDSRLTALGFRAERVFARPKSSGIFGSGCDEYVYRLT
jgi:2-polyprenyl-6-hydroxyphenyl methylase/3-demethylubiquinone-9 3-methyltransferase